jgi:WD40 repeat protein
MGAALSGSHVLTWNKDTEARVFDGGRLVAKRTLVADGAFLPDGRVVVVSGSTATAAEVLDQDTGRVLVAMRGPLGADVGVGGDRIATVGLAKGDVQVWDSRSGREVARFGEGARAVSLSPDGRRAIVMTLFGGVSSWDATTGKRLGALAANAGILSPAAAFSPDGQRAALTSAEGPVPIWDLRSARPERMLVSHAQFPSEVIGVAWGGDRIAVADRSDSGDARIFDAATGGVVAELREHTGEIRSIAFSPDDRWLVTASRDGTAWVWEAATGRPVLQLLGHRGPLVTAAFDADGRHVLTASKDGTARIHDCAVCAPLDALMRMRPARALTGDERRVYLHEH